MDPFKQLERKKAYSARSQASFEKQWELEHDLYMCTSWFVIAEKNVPELKEIVGRLEREMVTRGDVSPERLGDFTRKLEDEERRLKALKLHKAQLECQIKNLKHPAPERAAERLKHQIALGRLASERLAWDREIGRAADGIRQMLERRAKISASMKAEASAIDLQGSKDLDQMRFTHLMDLLPTDLVEQSERWAAWFSGAEQGKKDYTVLRDRLTFPETLADWGCYAPGETVKLTGQHARELLADGSVAEPEDAGSERQEAVAAL